jgi:RNA polymerase sigma-70 factor (ECF subfamily)
MPPPPSLPQALKELFQQEFAKMVAVISNLFGLQHIEMAEDIVSETFLTAAEDWEKKGIPENPAAWLYTVAKRKTIHGFRRQETLQKKIIPALTAEHANEAGTGNIDLDFSPKHIRDSQLQMLFAVCNPSIAGEAQIGLALRVLCGFGIDYIA